MYEQLTVPSLTSAIPEKVNTTVLIIDDEKVLRESLVELLEIAGLSVMAAASETEGVQIYRSHVHEIGVTLLNVSASKKNSIATLKRLREINQAAKIVLTSGYPRAEIPYPADDNLVFLRKPFGINELLEKIRELSIA